MDDTNSSGQGGSLKVAPVGQPLTSSDPNAFTGSTGSTTQETTPKPIEPKVSEPTASDTYNPVGVTTPITQKPPNQASEEEKTTSLGEKPVYTQTSVSPLNQPQPEGSGKSAAEANLLSSKIEAPLPKVSDNPQDKVSEMNALDYKVNENLPDPWHTNPSTNSGVNPEPENNPVNQKPVVAQNTQPAENQAQEETPASSNTPQPLTPKRRGFPKKIILILLAGLSIMAFVYFVITFLGKNKSKNASGELTWWGLWEDERYIKPIIDEFEKENPGVTVKYLRQSQQDYRERLSNAFAKGEGPDIFRFHNTWAPMFAKELDQMPASVMAPADFVENYYPIITENATGQNGIVGIPLGYDALTLYINEDLFNEAQLDPPTTWVELRERAKLLTKYENGVISQAGVALGRTENVDHWQEVIGLMMLQNGVNMNNPVGQLTEDALVFYTLFSSTDKVWDETLPPSTTAFASGKLAMYFGPSWRYFNIKEANPDLNFRTVPLPQLPKESPDEPNVSYATYWLEGVWTRGENKDLAWKLLKKVSEKENLEKTYTLASQARGFGEAYPRIDMANSLIEHPILGSIMKLAPEAQSWYLADRTFDGTTGINSQIGKYFADAISAIYNRETPSDAVETLAQGVSQVLAQYGLVSR